MPLESRSVALSPTRPNPRGLPEPVAEKPSRPLHRLNEITIISRDRRENICGSVILNETDA